MVHMCVCFAQQCNSTDSHCSPNIRAFAQPNQIIGLTEQQIQRHAACRMERWFLNSV